MSEVSQHYSIRVASKPVGLSREKIRIEVFTIAFHVFSIRETSL